MVWVSTEAEMGLSFKGREVSLDPAHRAAQRRAGTTAEGSWASLLLTEELQTSYGQPAGAGVHPLESKEEPRDETVGLKNQDRESVGFNSFPALSWWY